jgi:hypothetical protein
MIEILIQILPVVSSAILGGAIVAMSNRQKIAQLEQDIECKDFEIENLTDFANLWRAIAEGQKKKEGEDL